MLNVFELILLRRRLIIVIFMKASIAWRLSSVGDNDVLLVWRRPKTEVKEGQCVLCDVLIGGLDLERRSDG